MKNVSGEVRLKLKFSAPASYLDLEAGLDGDPNAAENMEGIEEKAPNELSVTAVQARRLPAMNRNLLSGGGPSSDPLVKFKIEGLQVSPRAL